jgi:hypothetical protein
MRSCTALSHSDIGASVSNAAGGSKSFIPLPCAKFLALTCDRLARLGWGYTRLPISADKVSTPSSYSGGETSGTPHMKALDGHTRAITGTRL